MGFQIVMTTPRGDRQVVSKVRIRRFNGAVNELNAHVESKRMQLRGKCLTGDRVVSGPAEPEGNEETAMVVVMLTAFPAAEQFPYRYAVERR